MGAFCMELLVRIRLPGFSPARVLGFGDGTGSAFWALQVMWPQSLEKVKLDVPSQSMQNAGWSLIQGMKNLPLTHSYGSIKALTKSINKSERGHDLVIAVLVEPGTPHGFNAVSQM